MTGKRQAVVTRRRVLDGVICAEEIAVTVPKRDGAQPGEIAEAVAGLDEVLPDGRDIVRVQGEAAQAAIDSGATGDRLADARHMVKLARAAQSAIDAGDADSAVMLAVALTRTEARLTIKGVGKEVRAGAALRRGGRKGAPASKATRGGPDSKREKIRAAASSYQGADKAKVATIVKRTGATPQYVREVLKNTKL